MRTTNDRRANRWFRRGKGILSNSRQSRRWRLWKEAKQAVNEANETMLRKDRRKLAKAYFAGEWKIQNRCVVFSS